MSSPAIHGHVETGFGPVADAFAQTLAESDGAGQACAVVVAGRTVVDLWGGAKADGTPWAEATRSPVFSVSKGVTAICLVMAADRGLLNLDAPVAALWPEFGVHGKDRITVREALAHRAGVPAFSWSASIDDIAAWDPVVEDLAAAVPLWEPGASHLYHAITVGFLAGEILRRATGRRPAAWLADEIAGPLGLALTFGADPSAPDFAAPLAPAPGTDAGVPLSADLQSFIDRAMLADGAYGPDIFTSAGSAAFLGPESPAGNLVASARDLATLYAAAVQPIHGVRLLSADAVAAASRPLSWGAPFLGPDKGDVWGTGFMVHSSRRGMAGPGSFGHDGAGGQLAFAHPESFLGFGFQTIQPRGEDDRRAENLSAALRGCL